MSKVGNHVLFVAVSRKSTKLSHTTYKAILSIEANNCATTQNVDRDSQERTKNSKW